MYGSRSSREQYVLEYVLVYAFVVLYGNSQASNSEIYLSASKVSPQEGAPAMASTSLEYDCGVDNLNGVAGASRSFVTG